MTTSDALFHTSYDATTPPSRKLGIALVGLGHYALDCVAPALERSKYWKITGVVSGDAEKRQSYQAKWSLNDDQVFSYEEFDRIALCSAIDAVYICLPNHLHAEFTIRAARAGKHVIVEKPLALNEDEGKRMIDACRQAGVKLAIGYRLRFNALHLQLAQWGQQNTLGEIQYINAIFSIQVGPNAQQWRLRSAHSGGGALMDVGIYCIQAARYITQQEPISVTAQLGAITDPKRFDEVEESISWQMKFPNGTFMTGYAGFNGYLDEMSIAAKNNVCKLDPAFSYGPLSGHLCHPRKETLPIPHEQHQYCQMESLGAVFLNNSPIPDSVSGEEGLRDLRIIAAIYQAARTGKEVFL